MIFDFMWSVEEIQQFGANGLCMEDVPPTLTSRGSSLKLLKVEDYGRAPTQKQHDA